MAELATLARPYAKAAFDYAAEHNAVATWSKLLDIASAMLQDRTFADYIKQPNQSPADRVKTLVNTLSGNNDLRNAGLANFLSLLSQNNRLALLPQIQQQFELLKAQGLNETDVVIESAYPLSQSQELLIATRLEQRLGTKVNSSVIVRPELIGGVIIRAGDQVIDDSALGKLEKMRIRLSA